MKRPKPCNCRCYTFPPDCFGCSPYHEIPENVTLDSSGFSWLVPTLSVTYETVSFFSGTQYSTTEHRFRSRDIASINGTKLMRRKPSGECWWLWNDVRAVSTVWKDASPPAAPLFDEVSIYEPLNATDSTNPWDRVILPNADVRCVFNGPRCEAGIDASTTLSLVVATNVYGDHILRLTVHVKVARSATTNGLTVGASTAPSGNFTLWGKPTPVNYGIRTAVGNTPPDYSTGASASPPYRYDGFSFFPTGGQIAEYRSDPIDCIYGFLGDPITLTNTAASSAMAAIWDATVPDTVEVTL